MPTVNVFWSLAVVSGWALILATTVTGQNYPPAIEYASLLDLRFYEQTGGFLVENLQLVFPPQQEQKLEFVIARATGEAVAIVPLRKERLGENFPAFARLQPSGHPGNVQVGQAGDFVMSVKANGQTLTTLPFTLRAEGSDDPFNPKKTFVLDGPWRSLAYLFVPVDEAESPLSFRWWMSGQELPADMKQATCTVHLMRGTQEICGSRTKVVLDASNKLWASRVIDFYLEKERKILTLAMLTAQDGDYRIVFKAKDKVIKSYAVPVKGGKVQRLKRCDLSFQPHTDFISPRLVDTLSGSSSRYKMVEAFWVEAGK
ncbi:MAG: hypothetical protein ONB46_07040 [candidate division KSB1 bacterium]|nr:hypothetical protein [candidate division KSB1 bacterium]MDZ7368275.1 hypothetical protein [candidate division KSB1 bacterium]MDZ7406145.1 hypothetical protein [candidate division KSB1 bacterium]